MLKNSQYDMDLKTGFIESLRDDKSETTVKMYESMINKISRVEQIYGISLCQADTETRIAMITDCLSSNQTNNKILKSRVGAYLRYCEKQNATVYSPDDITVVPNRIADINWKYFMDWDEFESYLDDNMNPDDLNTHDVIYRICFELIYLGVVPDDIYELKKEQFDYQESSLRYNQQIIELPASVRERLRIVRDMEFYEYYRDYEGKGIKVRVIQTDYLINDKAGSRHNMYKNLVCRLWKINKDCEIKHSSVYDIFISGAMDRAYQLPPESQIDYLCDELNQIKSKNGKLKGSIISIFETWVNIKESMSR